jgi:hypothetical protein
MKANAPSSTPLLLLILLAVLLQPLLLFLVLGGDRGGGSAPPRDPALTGAIRDLADAVRGQEPRAPAVGTAAPIERFEAAIARLADRLEMPREAGPLPGPRGAGETAPRSELPGRRERVETWIRHCQELDDRDEKPAPNTFFHRTKAEVLATFGAPDEAWAEACGARWIYWGPEQGCQLQIHFDGDRVYRFDYFD